MLSVVVALRIVAQDFPILDVPWTTGFFNQSCLWKPPN